jgi:hypothetical protein
MTALLVFGLIAGQLPGPAEIGPDDVRRLAKRLEAFGVGTPGKSPTPKELDDLKKLLEANPQLREEALKKAAELQNLPPAERDELLKDLEAAQSDPKLRDAVRRATGELKRRQPDIGKVGPSPRPTPKSPTPTPADRPTNADTPAEPPPTEDGTEIAAPPAAPPGERSSPTSPAGRPGGRDGYQKFARFWEQNVGPLKDMPAMQRLVQEFVRGRAEPTAGTDGGPLGGILDPATAEKLLRNLPDRAETGWQFPELNGLTDFSTPTLPGGGVTAPSAPSLAGAAPVAGLIVFLAVAAALVWLLPRLLKPPAGGPHPVADLGPWPLDPRAITDRAGLVRAFEYLSVLLNGPPARAFSHESAAAALRSAVPAAADAAEPLAAAYALARYTPPDQPLTAEQIASARALLCRLAGVPA